MKFNGGFSPEQLLWLDEVLTLADQKQEKVTVFSKYIYILIQLKEVVTPGLYIVNVCRSSPRSPGLHGPHLSGLEPRGAAVRPALS